MGSESRVVHGGRHREFKQVSGMFASCNSALPWPGEIHARTAETNLNVTSSNHEQKQAK